MNRFFQNHINNLVESPNGSRLWWHSIPLPNGDRIDGHNPDKDLQLKMWRAMQIPDNAGLEGQTVVDIGANDGFFSLAAVMAGAREVTSVDNHWVTWPQNIQYISEAWKVNTNIVTADFRKYDFKKKFDVIFFLGVLYHLEDVFGCMKTLRALLADHGVIYMETQMSKIQTELPIFEYASDIHPTIAIQNRSALSGVGISNYLFPNEEAIRNLAYSYDLECESLNGPQNVYTKENPSRHFYKMSHRRRTTVTAIPSAFRGNGEVQLPWTGERYVPKIDGDIEMEHLHRYAIARDLAYGKDVLDIACGEGYGSELLATVARKVTGVDISEEAIAHAARKYVRPNIVFAVGSCACIPLADASIDLVVSFDTLEHHDQHLEMMGEIRRVLHPDGTLIISSSDKHEYSDVPGYKNEYHVKELYLSEFKDLLATRFKHVRVFGQRVNFGSLVAPTDGRATRFVTYGRRDASVRREPGIMKPVYYIALASNVALPQIHGGLYDGTSYLNSQLADRDGEIDRLNQTVAERDRRIDRFNQAVAERDGQINALNRSVAERDGQITVLSRLVAERDGQINALNRSVAERDGRINALNRSVAERDKQINALNRSAAQRDVQITKLNRGLTKRDETIVGLNRTLAAEDAKLRALRSSTSWRVTAPLRFLKTAATSLQPRRRLRKAISITATSLYKALPLSVGRKVKLKGWLFSAFPLLFGHTAAYRRWAALMARNAADDTSPV
jgi:2-polyprenyl-3-methyl-5-hydroxy-6-metoxy-1,4-benzoquinol methylase/uncharacterized coiled-coil protein SlyX